MSKDMKKCRIFEDDIFDTAKWRRKIKKADPTTMSDIEPRHEEKEIELQWFQSLSLYTNNLLFILLLKKNRCTVNVVVRTKFYDY